MTYRMIYLLIESTKSLPPCLNQRKKLKQFSAYFSVKSLANFQLTELKPIQRFVLRERDVLTGKGGTKCGKWANIVMNVVVVDHLKLVLSKYNIA